VTTTFNAAATKTVRVNGRNFVYREIGNKSGIPVVFLGRSTFWCLRLRERSMGNSSPYLWDGAPVHWLLKLSGFLRSVTSHPNGHAGTMSGNKFMLFTLAALGTVSAGLAMAQPPAQHHATPVSPSQHQVIVYGSDRVAPDLDRDPHQGAVYSEPTPAPFNAYTYSASAHLVASGPKRTLQGEFRFPVFKATPNVSVQIISSISAVPMRVRAVKISEIVGQSGAAETEIIVEAEPIFDVPAGGFYFANLLVTGVPVSPPTASSLP
jgi:hypothetical protein